MYRFFKICLLSLLFSTHLQAQEGDCRVKSSDLKPIIERFNPFFSEHSWVEITKHELARMDKNRYLIIAQDGCKRHHNTFTLYLNKNIVVPTDSFWIQETKGMFRAVYYGNKTFRSFQQEFEEKFEEKLLENGINKEFNFPIGTRNFICEIDVPKDKDPMIRINMIEFVFEEVVKEMRKPNTLDDGWFVPPVPKVLPPPVVPTLIMNNKKNGKKEKK